MNRKKRVWLYCHIDAPEDTHGALKAQRQQLMDYAEQMGFEIAGCSCDTGSSVLREGNGLTLFYQAVTQGRVDTLLIVNSFIILRNPGIRTSFLAFISLCKIQVYSPLTGPMTLREK